MAVLSKPSTRRSLFFLLTTCLLLRSRIASFPRDVATKLAERARGGKVLNQDEIDKATQQGYVTNDDGSKTLLVLYKDRLSKVGPFK